ncbi:hypothetical protein [Bradyrhizobium cenepequi]|uniref:hypothetical protein n=1 Tax=Bradyrhizobium cenepequi TaxID=2821403 RepID=UPI001CE25E89|nr:hypothetical protein [Bradyrhizobium cenepequi]MCA6112914.1 hypothetical protein [Bradyrhizobium cenepequi]
MSVEAVRRIDDAESGIAVRRQGVIAGAWVAFLLAILGFLVIYPILTLLLGALTDTNPVVDRLQHRDRQRATQELDGPDQAAI